MNYQMACSTNLDECMLPLIDFIRTLVKPGEKDRSVLFWCKRMDSIYFRQHLWLYYPIGKSGHVLEL